MKKRILWKSDLWPFTGTFAFFTALCLLMMLGHAVSGDGAGEILASACVAVIPAILMCVTAFTDRTEAMRLDAHEQRLDALVYRTDLAPLRKGTMLDPEHPVIADCIQNPPTLG